VILTFALTLFGTFLTRSGVIGSVHAFTQGSIGIFFLGFLALVLLGARPARLALGDAPLRGRARFGRLARVGLPLNNVLLVAAAFTVFFGTVFPLLSEAVRGVKVSVGAPVLQPGEHPVFPRLVFLMGVGPLIAWRRASARQPEAELPVARGARDRRGGGHVRPGRTLVPGRL
jgi:cytochrome c-type biogenesis protein CcmF